MACASKQDALVTKKMLNISRHTLERNPHGLSPLVQLLSGLLFAFSLALPLRWRGDSCQVKVKISFVVFESQRAV